MVVQSLAALCRATEIPEAPRRSSHASVPLARQGCTPASAADQGSNSPAQACPRVSGEAAAEEAACRSSKDPDSLAACGSYAAQLTAGPEHHAHAERRPPLARCAAAARRYCSRDDAAALLEELCSAAAGGVHAPTGSVQARGGRAPVVRARGLIVRRRYARKAGAAACNRAV